MFAESDFNQDITGWDVSNITDMTSLFATTPFNQNISGWTTSNVTEMNAMFSSNSVFNQPIGNWDVSSVTLMNDMFANASAFNQSLANWDISSITNMVNMLNNCGMSSVNYDATLIGWEAQGPPTGLTLGAQGLRYTLGGAAEAARTSLITTYGWTINGDTGV